MWYFFFSFLHSAHSAWVDLHVFSHKWNIVANLYLIFNSSLTAIFYKGSKHFHRGAFRLSLSFSHGCVYFRDPTLIFCSKAAELISLICRYGSFCHTFYNSHSLMDCASGSFIKPPVCFQINSWHLCKLVFRCYWVLLAMDYNVKKRKKGVVASNQECILRPAEPQAISCVLAVRQDG